jgi:Tol biopolymer transport system component
MKKLAIALLFALPALAQRKSGSPLDHLPPNIEVLSYFGERADFSPDNKRIAFMDKSFGDAFVMDLATRHIHCLTCSIPGASFLRIMHLSNGDYILIGPEKFIDIHTSRARDNELWYLSAKPGSKPVRFGVHLSEGAAVSKKSMQIAYSELPAQFPDIPSGTSRMVTADVDLSGGTPKLTHRKVVYESKTPACNLEAQDFYDQDSKLTFICYVKKDLPPGVEVLANVMSLDLKTSQSVNMTQKDGTYNETEGIFPDGKYTCVEGDRQVAELGGAHGMRNIDIWKLKLDGTGKDFVRLTHFNDYDGWKASNPVVSTDGKFMSFQAAQTKDEAGVGYGIMLYRF